MPPKKAPAKKLHELAPEVRVGHQIPDVVNKKTYIVGKQFATGGFGRIHTCTEEGKSHQMVMKIEPSTNGPLLTEVVVFNRILKQEHLEAYKKKKKLAWIGLPYLIANGFFPYNGEKMRYMVIPKYALSLEGAREANGGTLSVKESLTVTNCVLGALEYLHSVDYTHADVKAANILLEKEGVYSTAVLVDFGLAHKTTNNVDKPDKKRAHNGTCIFTSTDAHRGNNPSYRGDVEILAYNIVMWLTGTLPWLSLEASPDKVFEAKQKFVNGLPGTLENVLQGAASAAVGCVTTMFKISQTTGYTSKVDMDKLRKIVTETIQKAPDTKSKSKKAVVASTSAPTAKKSARRPAKIEDDEDEEEEVKPKKKTTRTAKTPKVVVDDDEEEKEVKPKKTPSRAKTSKPRRIVDEYEEEEEVYIPKPSKSRGRLAGGEDLDDFGKELDAPSSTQRATSTTMKLALTSSTASANFAAKKIEQKYKRMQMNKGSMVPVTITIAASKSPESPSSSPSTSSGRGTKRSSGEGLEEETITLKTPALLTPAIKKAKYKSGISSATKASPTELRRVPGVRNFPKGRRSIIIKETAAKYSERRARQQPQPTFDDSSCSGSSELSPRHRITTFRTLLDPWPSIRVFQSHLDGFRIKRNIKVDPRSLNTATTGGLEIPPDPATFITQHPTASGSRKHYLEDPGILEDIHGTHSPHHLPFHGFNGSPGTSDATNTHIGLLAFASTPGAPTPEVGDVSRLRVTQEVFFLNLWSIIGNPRIFNHLKKDRGEWGSSECPAFDRELGIRRCDTDSSSTTTASSIILLDLSNPTTPVAAGAGSSWSDILLHTTSSGSVSTISCISSIPLRGSWQLGRHPWNTRRHNERLLDSMNLQEYQEHQEHVGKLLNSYIGQSRQI